MKILAILTFLAGSCALGFQAGPMGVYSNYSTTSFTQTGSGTNLTISPSGASGYGGGLASLFPLGPKVDLGIRAFYVNENLSASFTGTSASVPVTGTTTSNAAFYQIPVTLNLHLGQSFGIHAGGFYGIATGNLNSTTTVTALGVTSTSTSTSPNNVNDYGATGGIQFNPNLSASVKLLISADYNYGLANLNANTSGSSSTYSRSIQGSLGFLFNL